MKTETQLILQEKIKNLLKITEIKDKLQSDWLDYQMGGIHISGALFKEIQSVYKITPKVEYREGTGVACEMTITVKEGDDVGRNLSLFCLMTPH